METAVLKINGMTCTGCVNSVRNILQEIPGVSNVDVSLEQAQAVIQYNAATTNVNQFKDAIKDAGFEVASQ